MQTPETTSGWQSGYVSVSEVRHAVRPTLAGRQAWCGAGQVGRMHVGRFTSTDAASCPRCAAVVTAMMPKPRTAHELVATGT